MSGSEAMQLFTILSKQMDALQEKLQEKLNEALDRITVLEEKLRDQNPLK